MSHMHLAVALCCFLQLSARAEVAISAFLMESARRESELQPLQTLPPPERPMV